MQEKITTLFQYSDNSLFVISTYDTWLVITSIFIAILASFMGLKVASQAANYSFVRKQSSLFVGSIALGGGVWSMHFIGMLALRLCTDVTFKIGPTLLSVLPAIIASWIALNLNTKIKIGWKQLIISGILVGSGIGTMHYVGMAAMEMAPLLRYDLVMFCVSILVAVLLAILSLWINFGLNENKILSLSENTKILIASCVMGAAISGMHYTGMMAARFVLPPGMELSYQTNEISLFLAVIISVITVTIILLVLGVNLIFRYKDISAAATFNENSLRATMDTAIDGIVTINEKGLITSINKATTHLLGWQAHELIGQNVHLIVPISHKDNLNQYIDDYLTTRKAHMIGKGQEVEAMTKNGEVIPVRIAVGHTEFNNQHTFVAFISDLRNRRQMEDKLRKNEVKIRTWLTNFPGIAYRCLDKPGWPNVYINDEVENILGYPATDYLIPNPKRSLGDSIHPDDMPMILGTDLKDPDGYKLEFRMIDRYQNIKWVLGHGRAIKIDDTDEFYLDGFIMDITERKLMEEALVAEKDKAEKATATRTAFLANMSHEIRTPMNAIIGFSDLVLDDELSDAQRKQVSTINLSAKSLLHILNDILDSAKLDKGKFQLEYRNFSLIEEIDSVVSTLWFSAQGKGLEIILNVEKQAQNYYNGVPDRLRQVLTNLIGNAIKFTEQGKISIDISEKKPGWLTFAITDTGIGITPSQLETIFDAFAQADESMSRRFGGTGLGTTISKQLVELMGGTIYAKSESGQGSEFTFTIPLKTVESLPETYREISNVTLPPLNILIVDDIEQNLELLTLLLERRNHSIIQAMNGEQALLKMKNNDIDVVLMDIQMPVMDGLTAATKRREFELEQKIPQLPIIALTASVLPEDRRSAEKAGMDGFANKPIDVTQLMSEIACVLRTGHEITKKDQSVSNEKLSIDFNNGINLWGSKTKLLTEINRFMAKITSELEYLPNIIKEQQWKALEELGHKYKGVTGNLSLTKLMFIFSDLEQASKKELKEEAILIAADITTELKYIRSLSNKVSQKSNVLNATSTPEDKIVVITELIDLLSTLETHVNNNEFDESLLDKLQRWEHAYPNQVTTIMTQCNNFDFTLAAKEISIFINSLTHELN